MLVSESTEDVCGSVSSLFRICYAFTKVRKTCVIPCPVCSESAMRMTYLTKIRVFAEPKICDLRVFYLFNLFISYSSIGQTPMLWKKKKKKKL